MDTKEYALFQVVARKSEDPAADNQHLDWPVPSKMSLILQSSIHFSPSPDVIPILIPPLQRF
jgi:hypothetical protein